MDVRMDVRTNGQKTKSLYPAMPEAGMTKRYPFTAGWTEKFLQSLADPAGVQTCKFLHPK